MTDARVARLVHLERQRQDAKWGQQDHDDKDWFLILAEEFGELAQAILEERPDGVRELVEVTAVGWAWLEAYFRRADGLG